MRYFVLASDYDGTLALHGHVTDQAVEAVERLLATGRKLVLVTGRELPELLSVFPEIRLCEWVVAENGALLYRPSSGEEKVLAERPPDAFVEELRRRGVAPMSVGRAIVATWAPHETTVLEVIREQGLDLQVIFNKGAVMILPAGVNKATGLTAALREMGLSPHEAVGVGDAENDHVFLTLCECSAAVSNALPSVKERVDVTLIGDHGVGVSELIDRVIAQDLADLAPTLTRHQPLLGTDETGREVRLSPYGPSFLIAGSSGGGKSTLTTGLLERFAQQEYQICIIDPEGDYQELDFAVTLGSARNTPTAEEVLQTLADPSRNGVVNLVGLRLADRPRYFMSLLPQLLELKARSGRPHWLVIDEAHHLLPTSWEVGTAFPTDLKNAIFITVHPDQVHPSALAGVQTVLAIGTSPDKTIASFCQAISESLPTFVTPELEFGETLYWNRAGADSPRRVRAVPPHSERRRHTRKYAEGELPAERSFYFRGPEGKLNIRAQNLMLFLQLSDGVDEETWLYHLVRGDYSNWFREQIKDEELADETSAVERSAKPSAEQSRALVRDAIERRYTLPVTSPFPMPGTDAASARPTGDTAVDSE